MFGSAQSAPSLFASTPAQSASLFGAASSSSLFGGAPAQQSSSYFLFGGAAPQSSAGSLFGGAAASASSASLFGGGAGSSSLFGAPASSSSLFGAPASSSSLFGQQSGGGLFGSAPVAQPQQASAQQQQQVEITLRTRISQLPQNFQNDLFAVERHLREQRNKAALLWTKRGDVDAKLLQTKTNAADISRLLVKVRAEVDALEANANSLKAAVRLERASAQPVVNALENLSRRGYSGYLDQNGLPYMDTGSRVQAAHVPDEYFIRIVEELEGRATEYKSEIDEIAAFLKAQGVMLSSGASGFGNGGSGSLLDNLSQRYVDIGVPGANTPSIPQGTIEDVIRRQYEYFMVVASHIAVAHENLRAAREQFLHVLKERDADAPNPFQQADMREKVEKDRQRLQTDKRAAAGALQFVSQINSQTQPSSGPGTVVAASGSGVASGAGLSTSQASLFQSSAATGSLFGASGGAASAGSASGGLFGGGFSFAGSSSALGADSGDASRATRRKRE
ncbi:Nucleoporin p58/p45 [Gracilaria domingensis]|nr:Nucleoporin p58/p45 [Gracilaria domingensis]